MSSKLQIWNLALANISQTPSIQGINEDSSEANFCRVYYDDARKSSLQKHDWGFARKMLILAEVSEGKPDIWAYQYGYPTACLQARSIVKPVDGAPEIPFEIGVRPDTGLIGGSDAKVIFTDKEEAILRYTYDQEDTTFFSAGFTIYLSWVLSTLIAFPITSNRSIKVDAGVEAERQLLIAKAENMNEQRQSRSNRDKNAFNEAHG